MTKPEIAKQLVQDMRQHTGSFTLAMANRAVERTFDIIAAALADGEPVTLKNFATLTPVTHRARKARDIIRARQITVPERRSIRLTLSAQMKSRLNPQPRTEA